MADRLEPLSRRYDVVVANPPYMGANNLNKWLNGWTKQIYPNTCKDLCTCFIERGMSLAVKEGYEALITSDTCMYISSFEKMRKMILSQSAIVAFIDTRGTNAHPDVFDANAGWVLANRRMPEYQGSYFKLNQPIQEKQAGLLEALANPNCGWFHKTTSSDFEVVPGNPIAYWVGGNVLSHFKDKETLAAHGRFLNGMSTGKNEAVVRLWSEVSVSKISFNSKNHQDFARSQAKFAPYNKGGEYRKWYGNQWDVLAYDEESNEYMDTLVGHRHNNPDTYFRQCLSWSKISSGKLAMRLFPNGFVYDVAGCSLFLDDSSEELYVLALFNSSVEMRYLEFLAPTLNFEAGQIRKTPFAKKEESFQEVVFLSSSNIELSKSDWDSFEEAWGFRRHPLV